MKVLFQSPHDYRALWIELTPQKGYYHLLQEVRQSRIRVLIQSLKAREFQDIDPRLVAYLFDLEPLKICEANYFLSQDKNYSERCSFLIENYDNWANHQIPISTICYWYEQQKNKSFLERIFRTVL